MYWSAKGCTIPFSTTAGSLCVAKQFRTRYKGYFIAKNAHRSGDSVQAIPDQYTNHNITPVLIGSVTLTGRWLGPVVNGLLVMLPPTTGPISLILARQFGLKFAARVAG